MISGIKAAGAIVHYRASQYVAKLLDEIAPVVYQGANMVNPAPARQEFPLEQLIFTLLTMLIGKESKDWVYYKFDDKWWESRFYMRRN